MKSYATCRVEFYHTKNSSVTRQFLTEYTFFSNKIIVRDVQIICSVPNYCGVTIEDSECPKLFYCTFSLQNNEHDHRHSPTSKNNPRPLADDWGECGFVAVRQQSHGLRRLNYVPFYAVSRCITRQQVSDKCF